MDSKVCAVVGFALGAPAAAAAQGVQIDTLNADRPDHISTDIGVAVVGGGGVTMLTTNEGQEVADLGAAWEVRGTAFTRFFAGVELAYVGAGRPIASTATGVPEDAYVLTNGGEAALRLSAPLSWGAKKHWLVAPYAVGGINFSLYEVMNGDPQAGASSLAEDSSTAFALPLGGGVAFGYRGLFLDARVAYRMLLEDSLFPQDVNGLDSFSAGLNAGVEF
jgi:hypothetical protein